MIQKELTLLDKQQKDKQEQINTLFIQLDELQRILYQTVSKNINTSKKPKQSYGKLISKVILLNIIYYLDAKQIIQMRRVNRQFNKLIIVCLPFILEQLNFTLQINENTFSAAYLKQHQNSLEYVNFDDMPNNLKQIEYEYTGKICEENTFCLNLMFDLVTIDMPTWKKAKYTFQMKSRAIQEQINKNKFFLHYFNLTDKEYDLIKQKIQFEFRGYSPCEYFFDIVNPYVQNLIQLVKQPNYKELRSHYQKQVVFEDLKNQHKIIQNLVKLDDKKQKNKFLDQLQ